MRKIVKSIAITVMLMNFISPVSAAETVASGVNITSYTCRLILGMFTGYIPRTHKTTQYGANTYWSTWNIYKNDDGTYSIGKGGRYIRAGNNNDEVNTQTYIGSWERFTLEENNESYYIKTWRNTYLRCDGDQKDLKQVSSKEDAARWYFSQRVNFSSAAKSLRTSRSASSGEPPLLQQDEKL